MTKLLEQRGNDLITLGIYHGDDAKRQALNLRARLLKAHHVAAKAVTAAGCKAHDAPRYVIEDGE